VEEAFRNCIVPLLSMNDSVNVDFSEMPNEDGSFFVSLRVLEKPSKIDDLLSGFYCCLLKK
jgi:hypothetical protein